MLIVNVGGALMTGHGQALKRQVCMCVFVCRFGVFKAFCIFGCSSCLCMLPVAGGIRMYLHTWMYMSFISTCGMCTRKNAEGALLGAGM